MTHPDTELASILANKIRTCTLPTSTVVHRVRWGEATALCGYRPSYQSKGWQDTQKKPNCDECIRIEAGKPSWKEKLAGPPLTNLGRAALGLPKETADLTLPDEAPVIVELPVERWDLLNGFSNKDTEQIKHVLLEMIHTKLIKGGKTVLQLQAYAPSVPGLVMTTADSMLQEGYLRRDDDFVLHLVTPVELEQQIATLQADLTGLTARSFPSARAELETEIARLNAMLDTLRPPPEKPAAGKPLVIEVSAEQWAKGDKKKARTPKRAKESDVGSRTDYSAEDLAAAVLEIIERWPKFFSMGTIQLMLQGAPYLFKVEVEDMRVLIARMLSAGQIEIFTAGGNMEMIRLPAQACDTTGPEPAPDEALNTPEPEPVPAIADEPTPEQPPAQMNNQPESVNETPPLVNKTAQESAWRIWSPSLLHPAWTAAWHSSTGFVYLIVPGHSWQGKPDRWCVLIGTRYQFPGGANGQVYRWLESEEGKSQTALFGLAK